MKYRRVKKLDDYYLQADDNARTVAPEVKFSKSPGLNFRPSNAGDGIKHCNCKSCNTTRHYTEFVNVHRKGRCLEWDNIDKLTPKYYTSFICVHCLTKLHEEYKNKYGLDDFEALYAICALIDVYYDHSLAQAVFNDHDLQFVDGVPMAPDTSWIDRYFRMLEDSDFKGQSFWGSDNVSFYKTIAAAANVGSTEGMSDEDKDNYNIIWATYHYDPFAQDDPKDRPRLMANLVTMIDDAMKDDLVRMNAALEIVRAYYRIEKIGETLNQLQMTANDTVQNSNAIKQLTAAKTQETTMVTNFSKDHGFAAKYALAKSKGSGTLSAVIRDMKDAHYDFGTINKYDIETSAAIKQVSDISAESIFKQVGFSSAEYADMVREQAEELKRLRELLNMKEEELRLFKEKELKQELMEELREELKEKGIPTENVDGILSREYNKNRVIPPL